MKPAHLPLAKIVVHTDGLGTPSADTVRERALEIAKIDGRNEFNDRDWAQAKLELHGGHDSFVNGDDEMAASVSERDMISSDVGHRVASIRYDDVENAVELVAEGLDEAVHDQMLQAARMAAKDDESLA